VTWMPYFCLTPVLKVCIYHLLNKLTPATDCGVLVVGYYEELGTDDCGCIAGTNRMNTYFEIFCLNPWHPTEIISIHFLDYCFIHLSNPFFFQQY